MRIKRFNESVVNESKVNEKFNKKNWWFNWSLKNNHDQLKHIIDSNKKIEKDNTEEWDKTLKELGDAFNDFKINLSKIKK